MIFYNFFVQYTLSYGFQDEIDFNMCLNVF